MRKQKKALSKTRKFLGLAPQQRASLPSRTRRKQIELLEARQMLAVVDVFNSSPSVSEGSSAYYVFQLSMPSGQDIVIDYQTHDGSAAGGSDYAATSASVTIFAGQTSALVSVSTYDDSLVENDETFSLSITGVTNAMLGTSSSTTTTIIDNDTSSGTIAVWISGAGSVTEGSTAYFGITLANAVSHDVTVLYQTQDGYANNGTDYNYTSGSVVISAGEVSVYVSVSTIDDSYVEQDESFSVWLMSATGASISDWYGEANIIDNDGSTSTFSSVCAWIDDAGSVNEGATASFAVRLSSASGQDVTIYYHTQDGNAISNSDYNSANGSVVISVGQTSAFISISTNDDSQDEQNETFAVSVSSGTVSISDSFGVATILDNDNAPSLHVWIEDAGIVNEGESADFMIRLSSATNQNVTVFYSTIDGDAKYNTDYYYTSGSVVISAGETSAQVSVSTVDDSQNEADESFSVYISTEDASISDPFGEAIIADDDGDIELDPVGNAVAVDDTYSVLHDESLHVSAPGVLLNDHDPDLDSLTAVLLHTTMHGTLVLNSGGSFDYTPDEGFAGVDWFAYAASDGEGLSPVALVKINVLNTIPSLVDDAYIVPHDQVLNRNVLSNDTDADSDTLTVSWHSNAKHGTVTLNSAGALTYTPQAGFVGEDSFTYRITDGAGQSRVGVARISVTNTIASGVGDAYTVTHDQTLNIGSWSGVLFNDLSGDGDALSVGWHSNPQHGTLTLSSNGAFTYQPATGFVGPDAFYYRPTDGVQLGEIVLVVLQVTNNAPIVVTDRYSTPAGQALSVYGSGILGNDSDGNSDTLSIAWNSSPKHGTVTVQSNGSFVYTPNSSFVGQDSFTYTASDGVSQSAVQTVRIDVQNAMPTAIDDLITVTAGQTWTGYAPGLIGNDLDSNGDPLTIAEHSQPQHGTLTLNSNGSFTYTPSAGFVGQDSFTYAVKDAWSKSNTAVVILNVGSGVPTAHSDTYGVNRGAQLTGNVLSNDVDDNYSALKIAPDGEGLWHSAPLHGTLTLSANGSFTYVPSSGFAGVDRFLYMATDGYHRTSPR